MLWNWLESQARVDSPVRRAPAGLKLAVATFGVAVTVSMPLTVWPWFLLWSGLLLAVMLASRVSFAFWFKRLLVLEPFVLGVAILSLFQTGGGWVFVGILTKSTLSLLSMIVLSNTTPFVDLLRVLQRLRVPPLLVTTLALMYRYLHVLVDEMERMQRARACRTFQTKRQNIWQSAASMAGQLFVRSTERAERIYAAMCARGWK